MDQDVSVVISKIDISVTLLDASVRSEVSAVIIAQAYIEEMQELENT